MFFTSLSYYSRRKNVNCEMAGNPNIRQLVLPDVWQQKRRAALPPQKAAPSHDQKPSHYKLYWHPHTKQKPVRHSVVLLTNVTILPVSISVNSFCAIYHMFFHYKEILYLFQRFCFFICGKILDIFFRIMAILLPVLLLSAKKMRLFFMRKRHCRTERTPL